MTSFHFWNKELYVRRFNLICSETFLYQRKNDLFNIQLNRFSNMTNCSNESIVTSKKGYKSTKTNKYSYWEFAHVLQPFNMLCTIYRGRSNNKKHSLYASVSMRLLLIWEVEAAAAASLPKKTMSHLCIHNMYNGRICTVAAAVEHIHYHMLSLSMI